MAPSVHEYVRFDGRLDTETARFEMIAHCHAPLDSLATNRLDLSQSR